MFSRMHFSATLDQTARRFDVQLTENAQLVRNGSMISAFDHPYHPIIVTEEPQNLTTDYRWGLVPPDWNKEPEAIWNHTISAKLEYLNKRYSWQKVQLNRCLVPVTGYYEYHWNDLKGKSKTRFLITSAATPIFALAGLYAERYWNGQVLRTFAICTTNGNETMKFVHNKDAARNYSRMPVMLNPGDEHKWLDTAIDYLDFAYPNYRPKLIATPENEGSQGVLFQQQ
jgi:putative SOS response-associated peptidase YedK